MKDPLPENIEGAKRVTHSVNHQINWGYALVGLAVILVVLAYGPQVLASEEERL